MANLLAAALLLAAAPLVAGPPRVASYSLDTSFVPAESSMAGEGEIVFADPVLGAISFYLHGELRVETIRAGDQAIEFEEDLVAYPHDYSYLANRVTFQLPRATDRVSVKWKGYFNPSKARSPSDYMRITPDGVLLRGLGYSPWFPIFLEPGDDPSPVSFPRVTIRTPKDYTSVFTGELVSRSIEGDSQVAVWKGEGVSLHAAQVTARPFAVHREGAFYAYSMDDAKSRAMAAEILAFIGRVDGEYRRRFRSDAVAGQIHVMQMPRYGDISSGNAVGLSDGIWFNLTNDANARRGLAHELIHPFVSPRISRSDPLYAMVIEGFPSYFHLPVLADLGALDYDGYMNWIEKTYLDQRRTGTDRRGRTLPKEKPIASIGPDEIGVYKDTFVLDDRALLALDYFRRRMGAAAFDRFATALVRQPELTLDRFRETVSRFLPGSGADVDLWLTTSEFPERFLRSAPAGAPETARSSRTDVAEDSKQARRPASKMPAHPFE